MTASQPGPGDADYDELIGLLDLAAKVRLLTGATMFTLSQCRPPGFVVEH